ncbi:hypothetical protein LTR10_010945 [Elasticomyces elasticus]|nr:hypothetical protein LTR10_010945 [Elasticomyces elasticus]KAK4968550.1 hypothetical protein LTR42_009833 [Elasticomyces elasticus]
MEDHSGPGAARESIKDGHNHASPVAKPSPISTGLLEHARPAVAAVQPIRQDAGRNQTVANIGPPEIMLPSSPTARQGPIVATGASTWSGPPELTQGAPNNSLRSRTTLDVSNTSSNHSGPTGVDSWSKDDEAAYEKSATGAGYQQKHLWVHKIIDSWSWSAVGALAVVALLGTSLFTQNVVTQRFVTDSTPGTLSRISRGQVYDQWFKGSGSGREVPIAELMAAATTGFAVPFSNSGGYFDDTAARYTCPTGNCTFGAYSSLSICAHCTNSSGNVSTYGDYAQMSDGSISLDASALLNITSDLDYPDESSIPGVGPLIVHYKALAWGFGDVYGPASVECAAWWCVETYESEVVSNILTETTLTNFTNTNATIQGFYDGKDDIVLNAPTCYVDDLEYNDAATCTFNVTAGSHNAIQNFLSVGVLGSPAFLSGYQKRATNDSDDGWDTTSFAAQMLGAPCAFDDPNVHDCNPDLGQGLSDAFYNMTAYMSHSIRNSASGTDSYGRSTSSTYRFHIRYGEHYIVT